MASFLFYKYHFDDTGEKNLFSKEGGEKVDESYLNTQFAEDIKAKMSGAGQALNLYDFKKDSEESEIFSNKIIRFENGVAMLQLHNNKHLKLMPKDSTVAMDMDHFPYCLVIIDTRPESQVILVQKKRDAFYSADKVVKLIVGYCNRELGLSQLGWKMRQEQRFCKGSIWEIVKMRTANKRDRVRSLSIKIEGKKANENNEVDIALQRLLQKFSAPEGELKLISDNQASSILDESKDDIRNTVDLLIENKYRMRIGFEKSGAVEYGKESEAVYGVDDLVCAKFENGKEPDDLFGVTASDYDLITWLNTIIPEDDSLVYVQLENRKRNGRKRSK